MDSLKSNARFNYAIMVSYRKNILLQHMNEAGTNLGACIWQPLRICSCQWLRYKLFFQAPKKRGKKKLGALFQWWMHFLPFILENSKCLGKFNVPLFDFGPVWGIPVTTAMWGKSVCRRHWYLQCSFRVKVSLCHLLAPTGFSYLTHLFRECGTHWEILSEYKQAPASLYIAKCEHREGATLFLWTAA